MRLGRASRFLKSSPWLVASITAALLIEASGTGLAQTPGTGGPPRKYYKRVMHWGDSGPPIVFVPEGDNTPPPMIPDDDPAVPNGPGGCPECNVVFQGNGNTFGGEPPDPNIAAGPDSVVSVVNTNMEVHDKGGALIFHTELGPGTGDFFAPIRGGTGNIDYNGVSDPKVIFDQYLQKFVVIILGLNFGTNGSVIDSYVLIGVSKGTNPQDASGGPGAPSSSQWLKYAIVTSSDSAWSDYPGFGIDEGHFYITYNMFPKQGGGNTFVREQIISKANLLDPLNAPPQPGGLNAGNQFFDDNTGMFTMQPARAYGTVGGVWYASISVFNSTNTVRLRFRSAASPAAPGNYTVNVPPFIPANGTRQPNGITLENLSDRLMNAVWRDGFLWTTHAVQGPTGSAVRWYQFDTSGAPSTPPTLVQSGTVDTGPFGSTNVDNVFPQIAVSGAGDTVVSYSCSGPSLSPSICFAQRTATDPPGTMRAPVMVKQGSNSYVGFRWGDYSGNAVDPADDSTFWFLHEIATTNNDWVCWIGSFTGTLVGGGGGGPPPLPVPTSLHMDSPNGSENLITGSPFTIHWSAIGNQTAPVELYLYNGTVNVGRIATNLAANQGTAGFNWNVGTLMNNAAVPGGNFYRVRVSALNNPAILDDSDGFVRITPHVTAEASALDVDGTLKDPFTFAPGQTVQLASVVSQGLPPYFYTWSPQDFLDNANSPNPVSHPLRSVTYTLTVRDATGTDTQSTVDLIAGNPLVVEAGATQLFPLGGGVILEGAVAGGTPPYNVGWFTCDPATAGCPNTPVATAIQPMVFPNGPTIYYLRVIDASGTTRVDNVLVEPGFTVALENEPGNGGTIQRAPTKSLYRAGDQITFTATPGAGFTFQNWTNGATGSSNPVTIAFPSQNITVRAVYRAQTGGGTGNAGEPVPPETGMCASGAGGGLIVSTLALLFVRTRRSRRRL